MLNIKQKEKLIEIIEKAEIESITEKKIMLIVRASKFIEYNLNIDKNNVTTQAYKPLKILTLFFKIEKNIFYHKFKIFHVKILHKNTVCSVFINCKIYIWWLSSYKKIKSFHLR